MPWDPWSYEYGQYITPQLSSYMASSGANPNTYAAATQSGYTWNPVTNAWALSPSEQGGNVNSFATSALGEPSGSLFSGLGTSLSGLQSAAGVGVGGAGSPGVIGAGTGGPVSGGAGIPGIAPIDTSAATSAAFGAAKDQSGQEAQASLKSLRGLMGANGLSGSGMEAEGEKGIVESALGEMGSASRANATTQANNALDLAKTNQAAAITQRGQDIAAEEANASLAQQQAALQANSSLSMLKLALGLLPQVSISGNSNGNASASASLY